MLIQSHCLRLIIIPLCLECFVYSLWRFTFWTVSASHAVLFSINPAHVLLYASLFYLHPCVWLLLAALKKETEYSWISGICPTSTKSETQQLTLWRIWGLGVVFGWFSFLSPVLFSIVRPLQSARSHSAPDHQKLCGGRGNLSFGRHNKTLSAGSVGYSGNLLINYSSVIHNLEGYEVNMSGYCSIFECFWPQNTSV